MCLLGTLFYIRISYYCLLLYCHFLFVDDYKPILPSVFLKFIFDSTYYVVNFLAKKLEEGFSCDFSLSPLIVLLMITLLLIQYLGNSGIMILEVSSWFAIVKVYEHVGQITS